MATAGGICLELRPNRSLSGSALAVVFAVQAAIALLVAAYSASLGNVFALWFAAFELAAVGGALWWAARRLERGESIAIDSGNVVVRGGKSDRPWEARFDAHWVRVERKLARHPADPKRLLLSSHGRAIEIGAFLPGSERDRLEQILRGLLARWRQPGEP